MNDGVGPLFSMIERCQSAAEATALSRSAQAVFDQIERSSKPIVAAVYGSCLGGGLEVNYSLLEYQLQKDMGISKLRLINHVYSK